MGLDILSTGKNRVVLPSCSFIPLPSYLLKENIKYKGDVRYHRDGKIQLIEVGGYTLRKV
jgi:hypothetical protein